MNATRPPEPPGPTVPPVLLRVFPDYCADPVWQDGGMADLERLQVSARLRDELRSWAREWEELMGVREARYAIVDVGAHHSWVRRGRELAQHLQKDLGGSYVVEYQVQESEASDGRARGRRAGRSVRRARG